MDEATNIETLWARHYRLDSSSYHENMAATYERMFADPECEPKTRHAMTTAITAHKRLESLAGYEGSRPFTTLFPKE